MVIKGELVVAKRKRDDLIADLKGKGFKPYNQIFGRSRFAEEDEEPSGLHSAKEGKDPKSGFDYLLGMPIWSLTWERVEDLRKQLKEKTTELTDLQNTTPEALWERDLDVVLSELDRMDEEEEEMKKEEGRLRSGKRTKPTRAPKAKAAKGKAKDDGEDAPMEPDEEDDEEELPAPKKAERGREQH